MAKPKTSWSAISKNKTLFVPNRDVYNTLNTYDDSSLAYDDTSEYYDSYNANTGNPFSDKKDTNWTPT